MDVTIQWQDADSSSAKAVREIFPKAEIMLCGGHSGRAHRKILEKRQKDKTLPLKHVDKYKDDFPVICKEEYQSCKCVVYHSSGCGCLSDTFISKAHTNFTAIAQSQDEFVRRVKALPRHAVDEHSQCDYHPLVVCSCDNKDQIVCQGKPYKTKFRKFHARAKQVKHSNESNNVPIISLGRLFPQTLPCFRPILPTCMQSLVLVIPDLYRCMKLPVFDGVQEALQKHNVRERENNTS